MGRNGWAQMNYTNAVVVNPTVSLKKGETYPFVEMAAVEPGKRSVSESEYRQYKGGGARFSPGDTLMARITPCLENGKIARFQPRTQAHQGFGSTEFITIRGRKGITANDFAYYLTKWNEFRQYAIGQMTGTSGRQRVPADSLQWFDVDIPPIEEQHRIAHILGTLDDKIELNRRMNQTLEAMAEAIFKSWFIDFDPVHAKIKGRDTGLPAEIADLFPSEFEESEIGMIPKGWKVTRLKDMADVNRRSIKKEYPYSRIEYADISSVSEGALYQTNHYELTEAPSRAKRLVQTGDTIWSCVRPNRKAYLFIDDPADNLVVSTGFAVLSPKTIPPSYLHQWVTTQAFVNYLTTYATGAAYPAVKASTFKNAQMIRPTEELLAAYQNLVAPMRSRISNNYQQNTQLASLRDTLLPNLLTGKIDVSETKDIAQEVTA